MDRRKIKTRDAIHQAFLSALQKKELQHITVVEIAESANIGRGTFYLHYMDVHELYESIEKDFFESLSDFIDESFQGDPSIGFVNFMYKTAEYMLKHKEIAKVFLSEKGSQYLTEEVKMLFESKDTASAKLSKAEQALNQYETIFVVTGAVGVLSHWVAQGMQQTPEELTEIIEQIMGG